MSRVAVLVVVVVVLMLCVPTTHAAPAAVRAPRSNASAIPLVGYFCAQCDANPTPLDLVRNIHPAYTTIIFAFIGWDASGNITNTWDCNDRLCPKNFTLTRQTVQYLQSQGRKVLMSLGGAAGAVLSSNEPPSFVQNMVTGLVSVVRHYGLDGIDLDIENRDGDAVGCCSVVASIVASFKQALPGALVTMAPQMEDIYPDIADVSLAFNAQAPLVSTSIQAITSIQVQMYNTWAQVETVAYAEQYAAKLMTGYSAQGDGLNFPVQVPGAKLVLGYPASPSGASSGFIEPAAVVAMVRALESKGTPIGGLMTWSIGWDHKANWTFASAVAQG